MKVAITGGKGFLGGYVRDELLKAGYEPIILTRGTTNVSCTVKEISTDYSIESLEEALTNVKAVIHLAAIRSNSGLINDYQKNDCLTQNIYEVCVQQGIENVVYASTISVYSDEKHLPWTELQPPKPSLIYGISKLSGEHLGNLYNNKYGLKIKNLRLAHLFGFNEKNNYMINLFMRQAYNKQKISLNYQSIAKREFLYAKDAAIAIVMAMKKEDMQGTYNIGSDISLTNYEVAESINTAFNNMGNLTILNPTTLEGIHPSYMDNGYAYEQIGYKNRHTFIEALMEIKKQMEELSDVPIRY